MRWTFWRRSSAAPEQHRPLPDGVGLPAAPHPPAARGDRDDEPSGPPGQRPPTSRATPSADPSPSDDVPLTAEADVDRTSLAGAGPHLASLVDAVLAGTSVDPPPADARVLAVAATGALAARLPALSGVDGPVAVDEPADELLHAYADLLVGRAERRRTGPPVEREDLLAVAHLAAAAGVDAGGDPVLLLLAGVPAQLQVRAAVLLLAQTADDGGGAAGQIAGEVRRLFRASG